jgi:peptide/nickel transport system substrate-binding protein
MRKLPRLAAATALLIACLAADTALAQKAEAQKAGGVLQIAHRDSPASMSTLEEVTISTVAPMMAVFNNLVIFDQHVPQNSLQSIVPDLAAGWSWNEDGTELTFRLREGVRWHDGQPFTAKDVQCTWDMLLGKSAAKFRINPRKSWYWNLDRVTVDGDREASESAAAGTDRSPRFRIFAGLSLPCVAPGDAPASDRHRTVRIRFV